MSARILLAPLWIKSPSKLFVIENLDSPKYQYIEMGMHYYQTYYQTWNSMAIVFPRNCEPVSFKKCSFKECNWQWMEFCSLIVNVILCSPATKKKALLMWIYGNVSEEGIITVFEKI